jgi:hypothetical protein
MRRWACAALLCGALCGCGRCEEAPAPAEEEAAVSEPYQEIAGAGWSASVPARWERREEGVYVGPDRANVVVSVRDVEIPLELLLEDARADLAKANAGYVLLGQHEAGLNGLRALELHGQYERNGHAVTHHTVAVEGGRKKYVMTLSVVSALYPANQARFARIIQSFRGEFVR